MFIVSAGDVVSGSIVLSQFKGFKSPGRNYLVVCGCGNFMVKTKPELKRGGTSAMCYACKRRVIATNPNMKHRQTHGETNTYMFRTWENMRRRCRGCWNNQRWRDKGVTVCPEWENDYSAFADYVRSHLGERPEGYSLDRIDNERGYEPGNIRWATAKQQAENRAPGWKWKDRKKSSPAIDDPVWERLIGDLPDSMYTAQLAVHLSISVEKLRSILSLLGKKCITKHEALSDPLI